MTHLEIVAAIERGGGRLVASFELDARGDTVGAPREGNRPGRCGACGDYGHNVSRCRGPGEAPRPKYETRRRNADWLTAANGPRRKGDGLDGARAELARRIKARER